MGIDIGGDDLPRLIESAYFSKLNPGGKLGSDDEDNDDSDEYELIVDLDSADGLGNGFKIFKLDFFCFFWLKLVLRLFSYIYKIYI